MRWNLFDRVQAIYSKDGEFYHAVIVGKDVAKGTYTIEWDDNGEEETKTPAQLRVTDLNKERLFCPDVGVRESAAALEIIS